MQQVFKNSCLFFSLFFSSYMLAPSLENGSDGTALVASSGLGWQDCLATLTSNFWALTRILPRVCTSFSSGETSPDESSLSYEGRVVVFQEEEFVVITFAQEPVIEEVPTSNAVTTTMPIRWQGSFAGYEAYLMDGVNGLPEFAVFPTFVENLSTNGPILHVSRESSGWIHVRISRVFAHALVNYWLKSIAAAPKEYLQRQLQSFAQLLGRCLPPAEALQLIK